MKRMTFSEFFVLPAGVLFRQDSALAHRGPGLWAKGESYPADDEAVGRVVVVLDAIDDVANDDVVYEDEDEEGDEDGRRFVVFEADDLGRLAGFIEKARLVTERIG